MAATRVEGLLIERVDGELLVVRESSQEAHALNETAAIVFDLCDGSTSRAAMTAEVARRTGLPAEESVVDLALAELVEAGLVVLDDEEPPSITRRSLIRRLALPAAAMALLPVVETVLVPSRASGQSAPPTQSPTATPSTGPTPTPTPPPPPTPSPTPTPPPSPTPTPSPNHSALRSAVRILAARRWSWAI